MALAQRQSQAHGAAEITSRLLPMVVGARRLESITHLSVLDFGCASRHSLDFFSELNCRLQILDASSSLVAFASSLTELAEDADLVSELEKLFPEISQQRFDLVLLWDSVNLLPAAAIRPFFRFLSHHVHDGFRGHGFMLHKQGVTSCLRHFAISSEATARILEEQPVQLYMHNRKVINEAMMPLEIDHGVLHGDGRLEFLFH